MSYTSNHSLVLGFRFFHLSVLCAVIILQSCSGKTLNTGNFPDPDLIANIEIGQVSKKGVYELLGSPSSIATFSDNDWYYISEKTSTKAFFKPEIISRKVLIIQFDKRQIVKKIKHLSLKDGENIEMVDRVTPTSGKELTILQQIFGNVGRFEGDKESK